MFTYSFKPLMIKIVTRATVAALVLSVSACGTFGSAKKSDTQQKLNFVSAQELKTEQFLLRFMNSLSNSNANNILKLEAHEGRAITIDAKSVTVSQPVDLVAIFNSEAFRKNYGDLFPPTTNGWDAFIKLLGSVEKIVGSPVPWLADALKNAGNGISFTGDGNSVATDGSNIDNSTRGIQTEVVDPASTPLTIGKSD